MSDRELEPAKTQAMVGPQGREEEADTLLELGRALPEEPMPLSFRSLLSLDETIARPLEGGTAVDASFLLKTAYGQRYQARGSLGEGGMGEVRLSRDVVVGREVAIKTIRAELESVARERFLREARVQGQLEHPSVVPIYDLGLTEERRLFFTMKRVRGQSLDEILSRLAFGDPEAVAKYPARRLLVAFVQICLAIEYAHSRGVLHRDLKPGNVMLGDFGEVNVLDWGLAKVADTPEARQSLSGTGGPRGATLDGSVLGTPGYMAPEQAAGNLDQLDARSDVYALGAILYEMVALEPLHGDSTVPELITAAFRGPMPPLEGRASFARIPPELFELVRRSTAVMPSDRFGSARELADGVERYLDGERDELRRLELSKVHLEKARVLATEATTRVESLREVGRALALNPSDPEALTMLSDLLSKLPDDAAPGEAETELTALENERRFGVLRLAKVRAFAWVLAAPLFVLLGVKNGWRVGVVLALVLGNALLATLLVRRRAATDGAIRLALAGSTLCVLSFSMFYGPLLLSPVYAITNAMAFSLGGGKTLRLRAIGWSLAALLVPALATFVGLDGTYYASHGVDAFTVRSSALEVPLVPTTALLLAAFAASTISPALVMGRLIDRLAAAERRLALQAFHLRQLLPRG